MTAPASYRIVRRQPEHEDDVNAGLAEAFGAEKLQQLLARWSWQYLDNPCNEDGPVFWLAIDDATGSVLAQMGTMPLRLWWGDREVRASAGMDFFVRKFARGRGLGLAVSHAWADHVDVAIGPGLNAASFPLMRKIFDDVGSVPVYLKPLDATAIAKRRFGPVAGTVAGPVIAAGLRLTSPRGRRPESVAVAAVRAFTDEYDDLWSRARTSFACIVRRDARYLTWKYLNCPSRAYTVLEARRQGALTGFCVVRQEGAAPFPRGVVADVFSDASDRDTQDALVAAAVDEARRRRFVRIEAYCKHVGLGGVLRRHGFRAGVTAMNYCVAYRGASPDPVRRVADWHVMLGDGDLDRG